MLIVLAICLVGIIALLAIPVDIRVSVERRGAFSGQVVIAWLFGLVRYKPVPGRTPSSDRKPRRPKPVPSVPRDTKSDTRPDSVSKRSEGIRMALAIAKIRGFPRRTLKLATDLIGRVGIRILTIRGRVGLGDPAETGQLWGLLSAVTGMLAMTQHVALALDPDFERSIFEIDGYGAFRIIPLQIILTLTLFLLSPPALRAAWTGLWMVIRMRWK